MISTLLDTAVHSYECDSNLCPPGILQYQTKRLQWFLCENKPFKSLLWHWRKLSLCWFFAQMVQQRPGSVHVWPPVCSFTAYSIAWCVSTQVLPPNYENLCRTLPIILIMIPFGVISQYYKIVDQANNCSCWYNYIPTLYYKWVVAKQFQVLTILWERFASSTDRSPKCQG